MLSITQGIQLSARPQVGERLAEWRTIFRTVRKKQPFLDLTADAREQFANQVSGIVLDAVLRGAPVIANQGSWAGDHVEHFGAGVTISERTPAAKTLAQEHDLRHLLEILSLETV